MWKLHFHGKKQYQNISEEELCQDIIKMRYKLIKPNEREFSFISDSIDRIDSLEKACILCTRAETPIPFMENVLFWEAICKKITEEVARLRKTTPKESITEESILFLMSAEKFVT